MEKAEENEENAVTVETRSAGTKINPTLPYTDLQSLLVESSDIISKVPLQQVRHLILQHFADLSIRFLLR